MSHANNNQIVTLDTEAENLSMKQAIGIIGVAALAALVDYKSYKAVTRKTGMSPSVFMVPVNALGAGLKLFNKTDRKAGVAYLSYLTARHIALQGVRALILKIGS